MSNRGDKRRDLKTVSPLELWTLSETSSYLREDDRTTRRRVARGELPVIRLPDRKSVV